VSFLEGQSTVLLTSATPYLYSQLIQYLTTKSLLTNEDVLTRSLTGLVVPVVTFGHGPRVVIVVGRVHPGESNSSWVVHGLMNFLQQGHPQLKELLTFKIVPMINPDGVISGNYRTSIIGKDLNRLYLP
jgi:cytosolic carboxypeptidase protein 2/3